MNKFELFMKRVSDMPLYIKQLVYSRLFDEMKNFDCQDVLKDGESFSSYVPTLTFKGEAELSQKKSGFDGNIYRFLEYLKMGLSISEISVNTFLTLEETAKLFLFCLDENLIEKPENNIFSTAEYLSGKIRLGEYLVNTKRITDEQLSVAVDKIKTNKKLGEILTDLGYLTSNDIKAILMLKSEAQKRFVLDCDVVPKTQMECLSSESRLEEEISTLKSENKKLKSQLAKLLELVK